MSLSIRNKMGAWVTGLLSSGIVSNAIAVQPYNMPRGVTENSQTLYDLHMLVFWVCVVIGIGVFAVIFYSIFKHRKSKGYKAAQFHESTTVEVVWTVIPFVILIAVAVPATKALIKLKDVENADMTIKITGYQWKWKYDYLEEDVSFYSNLKTSRAEI